MLCQYQFGVEPDALSISIWSSFVGSDLLSVDRFGKMRLNDSMTISVVNPMVFGNVIGDGRNTCVAVTAVID